jgi:hypothetical protein
LEGFRQLPLDTLKYLFSNIDISVTVSRIEARYVNSGKGRHRYPVRSMLLACYQNFFWNFHPKQQRKQCEEADSKGFSTL